MENNGRKWMEYVRELEKGNRVEIGGEDEGTEAGMRSKERGDYNMAGKSKSLPR